MAPSRISILSSNEIIVKLNQNLQIYSLFLTGPARDARFLVIFVASWFGAAVLRSLRDESAKCKLLIASEKRKLRSAKRENVDWVSGCVSGSCVLRVYAGSTSRDM